MKWLCSLFISMMSFTSGAQEIDTSSLILLQSRGESSAEAKTETPPPPSSSGRYTILPPTNRKPEVEKEPRPEPKSSPAPEPKPQAKASSSPHVEVPPPLPPPRVLQNPEESYRGTKVEDVVFGGEPEKLNEWRDLLHPNDIRKNILELSVAPGYLYNDSDSNYWFRSYNTASPAIGVGVKMWFTPFFGLHSDYLSSVGADMKGTPDNSRRVPVVHQNFGAGVRFRRFFGLTRKAPYASFGIDYSDYRLRITEEEPQRIRIKTTGVKLSLDTHLPSSLTHAWTLGVDFTPLGTHEEISNDAVHSGSSPDFYKIGFHLGMNWMLERRFQLFWKLSHWIEKDLFEKSSSGTDPVSGVQPKGVSITNTFTLFSIGFTWAQ